MNLILNEIQLNLVITSGQGTQNINPTLYKDSGYSLWRCIGEWNVKEADLR